MDTLNRCLIVGKGNERVPRQRGIAGVVPTLGLFDANRGDVALPRGSCGLMVVDYIHLVRVPLLRLKSGAKGTRKINTGRCIVFNTCCLGSSVGCH